VIVLFNWRKFIADTNDANVLPVPVPYLQSSLVYGVFGLMNILVNNWGEPSIKSLVTGRGLVDFSVRN
jgi:hypothetical protein